MVAKGKSSSKSSSTTKSTPAPQTPSQTTTQAPVQETVAEVENAWEEKFRNVDASLRQIITLAKNLQNDVKR